MHPSTLDPQRCALLDRYTAGLKAYRAGFFADASAHFSDALDLDPEDGPSRLLCKRLLGVFGNGNQNSLSLHLRRGARKSLGLPRGSLR